MNRNNLRHSLEASRFFYARMYEAMRPAHEKTRLEQKQILTGLYREVEAMESQLQTMEAELGYVYRPSAPPYLGKASGGDDSEPWNGTDDGDYDEDDIDNSDAKPQSPQSMSISPAGIAFIAHWEKFRPSVYLDQGGKPTIGYGHLIKPGESFPNGITEQEAQRLLAKDIRTAEQAVRNKVKVPLTQNQFDALTSFAYNVGSGHKGFGGSTLLRLLNQGDYSGAADQFPAWNKTPDEHGKLKVSDGLVKRRNAERNVFLYGTTEP